MPHQAIYQYRFSVFTATYNRGQNLYSLFNDLCNQTYKNFEWVVVNDGSTDNTDSIIQSFIATKKLNITYINQAKNGGKHNAWREALKAFKGRYIITADDDDPFLNNALEIHNKYWKQLESDKEYDSFWEVRTRCIYPNGEIIGRPLPAPYFDSNYIDVNFKYKNNVEMVGSRKVEVLRNEASVPKFHFEENCSNFPEALRWIRAAKAYKTRFVPDVTRIYRPNPDGLTVVAAPNKKSKYNTLIWGGYMLLENRKLLIKWTPITYAKLIILVGYISAQLNENPSPFKLSFPERLFTYLTFKLSKIYLKLKKA